MKEGRCMLSVSVVDLCPLVLRSSQLPTHLQQRMACDTCDESLEALSSALNDLVRETICEHLPR